MNFKVLSDGEKKQAIFFDTILHLHVFRPTPQDELPAAEWVVLINGGEEGFQFDGKRFFLYENNKIENNKEIERHQKEGAIMEKAGKTTAEINKHFEGKGTQYLDRVEYKLSTKSNWLIRWLFPRRSLVKQVNNIIKSIS